LYLSEVVVIDENAVKKAYARWAPIYDWSFGAVAEAGRKYAVELINRRQGAVLEAGVGTGISLPDYAPHLEITGFDLSPEMLAKARRRVAHENLENVKDLLEMDASALDFPDGSFDTVVAMYVMTVVPDPAKVMAELERVCAPGGEVIIINHFSQAHGMRGMVEKAMSPFAKLLGWRPEFPIEIVTKQTTSLRLREQRALNPFGIFTMLRFVKDDELVEQSLAS
jgi:phosphatidylethanolamine/phosphatidyl-N-methylethanolamine N-methyltransferase